jgi:hypothetical protein
MLDQNIVVRRFHSPTNPGLFPQTRPLTETVKEARGTVALVPAKCIRSWDSGAFLPNVPAAVSLAADLPEPYVSVSWADYTNTYTRKASGFLPLFSIIARRAGSRPQDRGGKSYKEATLQ